MAAREKYPFQSDSVIEFVRPADVVAENALDNTGDGATCTFKVYDPAKDESLSGVEAIGQTILSVVNTGVFKVGDLVELTQDDETIHSSVVSTAGIDTVNGTVTIDDVTTVAAAAGNRFRVVFGTSVTMTEFGTPVFGKTDYGFRGTLADTHPVQILDQEFDIEVRLVGAVAGGLNLLDVLCGVIKPAKECDC